MCKKSEHVFTDLSLFWIFLDILDGLLITVRQRQSKVCEKLLTRSAFFCVLLRTPKILKTRRQFFLERSWVLVAFDGHHLHCVHNKFQMPKIVSVNLWTGLVTCDSCSSQSYCTEVESYFFWLQELNWVGFRVKPCGIMTWTNLSCQAKETVTARN